MVLQAFHPVSKKPIVCELGSVTVDGWREFSRMCQHPPKFKNRTNCSYTFEDAEIELGDTFSLERDFEGEGVYQDEDANTCTRKEILWLDENGEEPPPEPGSIEGEVPLFPEHT